MGDTKVEFPVVNPPHPRSQRGNRNRGPSRPEQAGSSHLGWRRRAAGPGCHLPRAGAPGKTCRADRSPAVGRTRHKAGQNWRLGCTPPRSHREGSPTWSRCRTLLARRSNTTRLWSSLPEMICLSSASTASTALECSLRLFTRVRPAGNVVMDQGRWKTSALSRDSRPTRGSGPPSPRENLPPIQPLTWQLTTPLIPHLNLGPTGFCPFLPTDSMPPTPPQPHQLLPKQSQVHSAQAPSLSPVQGPLVLWS